MSRERLLATGQTGIAPFPMPVVRMTAILELFGVAGLVLPWVLDTYRVLTPAAAIGLGVVMYGAAVSHACCASRARWRRTSASWSSARSSPPGVWRPCSRSGRADGDPTVRSRSLAGAVGGTDTADLSAGDETTTTRRCLG